MARARTTAAAKTKPAKTSGRVRKTNPKVKTGGAAKTSSSAK